MYKLLNAFHCLSIRKKLVLAFAIIVIAPLLVSTLASNKIVSEILLEKLSNANIDSLNRTTKRVDTLLDDIIYTLLSIGRNSELNRILTNDMLLQVEGKSDISKTEVIRKDNKINFIFESIPFTISVNGSNITILGSSNTDYGNWEDFYKYSPTMKKEKWYSELMSSYSENVLWIGVNKSPLKGNIINPYVIEAAMPVKEQNEEKIAVHNNIGVIHIDVPERVLYENLSSDNMESNIYMIDKNGIILSCKNKNLIKLPIGRIINSNKISPVGDGWYIDKDFNNKKIVVAYSTVEKTDWKVISVMTYNKMLAPLFNLRNFLIITNLICMVSFIFVALVITNSISKPIIKLSQKMKRVEKGSFDERAEVKYNDEVGILSRNFNNMLEKVSELLKLTKMQEKLKREAEFDALQAQINPHFLFNTLSSIRWAAAAQGNTKIEEMVLALSNLLKMSINKGPDMIALREEIAILRHYISLLQMKQGLEIHVNYNINDELLDVKIPRLLLQPIVENSIIHGFEEMKEGGMINIFAKVENDVLTIEISDNGKGINTQKLQEIMNGTAQKQDRSKYFGSIGVRNVNDRIKLNYGDEYGLTLKNNDISGTTAILVIPYKEEEDHAESPAG